MLRMSKAAAALIAAAALCGAGYALSRYARGYQRLFGKRVRKLERDIDQFERGANEAITHCRARIDVLEAVLRDEQQKHAALEAAVSDRGRRVAAHTRQIDDLVERVAGLERGDESTVPSAGRARVWWDEKSRTWWVAANTEQRYGFNEERDALAWVAALNDGLPDAEDAADIVVPGGASVERERSGAPRDIPPPDAEDLLTAIGDAAREGE